MTVAVREHATTATQIGTAGGGSGDIRLPDPAPQVRLKPVVVTITSPGRTKIVNGPFKMADLIGKSVAEARTAMNATATPVHSWPAFVNDTRVAFATEPGAMLQPGAKLEFEDP